MNEDESCQGRKDKAKVIFVIEGAYMQVALMLRGPQQFENLGRAPRKEPKACRYSNEPSIN